MVCWRALFRFGGNEEFSILVSIGQVFTDKGEKLNILQVRLPIPFGDQNDAVSI